MAGFDGLVNIYRGWGIQVLVLLSLAMQVTLVITAEIRRRKNSGVLKVVVWSAYLMADSTAIYALGHMSVGSRSPEQQQLMALWASFLLMHLGGQDNITAYSLEDIQLWLRHLQLLAVQVAAAAYVLYESSTMGNVSLLWRGSILVFVVGVIKYGERVWALKCASASGNSMNYGDDGPIERPCENVHIEPRDTEDLLRKAHLMLPVAGIFFNRPMKRRQATYHWGERPEHNELFTLVEMQLGLMHDVFYSKKDVIHNWYGLLIRIISWASTATAFVLFRRWLQSGGHSYSRADVNVTYILLVGAIVLEATSLLRASFSTWALTNMGFLGCVISPLRQLVLPERRSWWSNSMGQLNMFELHSRRTTSRSSRIARRVRVEEPWNTMVHSSRIPVSQKLKQLVVELCYLQRLTQWGEGKGEVYTAMGSGSDRSEMDLHECIIVWHIATEVYLRWYKGQEQTNEERELVEAIEALSNYMIFLLAARPYMLSSSLTTFRQRYSMMCGRLDVTKEISAHDFVSSLQAYGSAINTSAANEDDLRREFHLPDDWTLQKGCHLGAKLIDQGGISAFNRMNQIAHKLGQSASISEELELLDFHDYQPSRLKLIALAWAKMLFDAGTPRNPDSHCKQLNNGGEFLTVTGLVSQHITFSHVFRRALAIQSNGSTIADV